MNVQIISHFTNPAHKIPKYATPMSAAVDLRLYLVEDGATKTLEPGESSMASLGIQLNMTRDIAAFIFPRSGLGSIGVSEYGEGAGLVITNGVAVIDADYHRVLFAPLVNRTAEPLVLAHGDRILQLVFMPVVRAELEEVDSFDNPSARGGLGSTGIK